MPGVASAARGLTFSLSAPGVQSFSATLSRFSTAVSDFRPFWTDAFLPRWTAWEKQAFSTQGASTGTPWPALSDRYAAWKRGHIGGEGLLVRRGSLSSSLIYPSGAGGLGIWRPQATSLEVGTRVPYAVFHQLGQQKRRPVIRFTTEFSRLVAKDLQAFVSKAWNARRQQVGGA
jgi:phage gpG-like protein